MTFYRKALLTSFFVMILMLSSCSSKQPSSTSPSHQQGTRDNTPMVLEPIASGDEVVGNQKITFDISHKNEGYIMVQYIGDNSKVKVRIQNPDGSDPYTYDIKDGYHTFPLTGGSGEYTISAYENISGTSYSQLFSQNIQVDIENEFLPFLYPNQYVNFNASSQAVEKGKELAQGANNDLDVVSSVYDYVIHTLHYDDDKADLIKSGDLVGYLPDIDDILNRQKGICFDYAALMATMLRTQRIPTRMMIGYASMPSGNVYHAWISVYIKDVGWVDDLIEFDGQHWSMMDPTLISDSGNSSKMRNFITNQDNYLVKYLY